MFRKPLPSGSVRRPALTLEPLEGRDTPAFLTGAEVVVAADAGSPPLVRIIDPTTQVTQTQFLAYDSGFYGGVRVAVGDVTGDGYPDLVVAAGPSGGPAVQVYDGATGSRVSSFFVFDPAFTDGVFVAVGDVNGDGTDEVIASAGAGGGPQVGVFNGVTGARLGTFFAYDASFTGGVRVAAGDVDGDGTDEILTVPGRDGGPAVRVLKFQPATGSFQTVTNIFAYDPSFRGGMYVAAGDVNGDGKAEVISGTDIEGGPAVGVYALDGRQLASFYAYDPSFRGGVRVAAEDLTGDGKAEIITGAGPGGGPQANVFSFPSTTPMVSLMGLSSDQRVGIQVAGSARPLNIPATPDAQIAAAYAQLQAAEQATVQAQQAAHGANQITNVIYPGYPLGYYPFLGYGFYPFGFFGAGLYGGYYGGYGGYYDPGYYNAGYYDPGFYDPGYYDPGFYDPGFYDPGFSDAGFGDFGDFGGFDPGVIDV